MNGQSGKGYRPPRHSDTTRRLSDRHRNRDAFLQSAPWRRLRAVYLACHPVCEACKRQVATDVHHKIDRSERPNLALDESNLEARCHACHAVTTAHRSLGPQTGRFA